MHGFESGNLHTPQVLRVEKSLNAYECEVRAPGRVFRFRTNGPDEAILCVAVQGTGMPAKIPEDVEKAAHTALHDYFIEHPTH